MARIFPSRIPDEIRKDPRRSAECRVYDCLKEQLGNDFTVFYSSPWLGTKPDGSEVDGEADFIVANPRLGILVIEVKGGRIEIDSDNQWRSKDRDGITYKIKNPVEQARRSKHELRDKLKKSPAWGGGWITDRHGIILPDVARPDRDLRPDMPRHIFAFSEDMAHLEPWIRSRFSRMEEDDQRQGGKMSGDPIPALNDMLARPIQLRIKLHSDVSRDLHEIELLTDEQFWLLRELEANPRMAIAGAAGTGKTVLALQKAILLAEIDKRVLLLCYNRPLAEELSRLVANYAGITAMNFHQFCQECARRAKPGQEAEIVALTDRNEDGMVSMLVDIFADSGMREFDALIIDEGQDFRNEWLTALEAVVRDGRHGVLYIFYDDNQNVMRRSVEYIRSMPLFQYRLSRNFRNTKAIFHEAARYYSGDFVRAIGPPGVDVRWHTISPAENVRSTVSECIGNLVSNEGIRPEQVAVLVPDSTVLEQISGNGRIGRYWTTTAGTHAADHVVIDTIRRFKGLESPVVLLVLVGELRDEYDLLYTGITRAQSILEIIGPGRMLAKMRKPADDTA